MYARFFLHTLNAKPEILFFKFCEKILPRNGKILLEFRTINDLLILKGKKISQYERITDHYRRFIDIDFLLKRNERKFVPIFKIQGSVLQDLKKKIHIFSNNIKEIIIFYFFYLIIYF